MFPLDQRPEEYGKDWARKTISTEAGMRITERLRRGLDSVQWGVPDFQFDTRRKCLPASGPM